jgi:hypothetical protein
MCLSKYIAWVQAGGVKRQAMFGVSRQSGGAHGGSFVARRGDPDGGAWDVLLAVSLALVQLLAAQ